MRSRASKRETSLSGGASLSARAQEKGTQGDHPAHVTLGSHRATRSAAEAGPRIVRCPLRRSGAGGRRACIRALRFDGRGSGRAAEALGARARATHEAGVGGRAASAAVGITAAAVFATRVRDALGRGGAGGLAVGAGAGVGGSVALTRRTRGGGLAGRSCSSATDAVVGWDLGAVRERRGARGRSGVASLARFAVAVDDARVLRQANQSLAAEAGPTRGGRVLRGARAAWRIPTLLIGVADIVDARCIRVAARTVLVGARVGRRVAAVGLASAAHTGGRADVVQVIGWKRDAALESILTGV